jgi:glutamate synthase (ferredoxin)
MTGGRVVILGRTGRNFAAGMSGGIAYALDETGDFASRCNRSMVTLERLENPVEISEVEQMVWSHARYTGSQVAWKVLALWESSVPKFIKVMPRDYRRMLEEVASAEKRGAVGDDAVMAAFQANRGDLSRVSGN